MASALAIRLVLTAIAVLICYQFHWTWLRYVTSEWNLRMDAVFGVRLDRVAFDSVVYRGLLYRYVVACTMADVFCGALPLIWRTRDSIARNLTVIAAFAIALFLFNVTRLSFSDVLFAHGLNWDLAHNVVSGLSYFAIWEWLRWRGAWRT